VTVKASLADGVIVVACNGALTTRSVLDIRRWAASEIGSSALAVVMDYRRCVRVITEDEALELARTTEPSSPAVPLAWLVADDVEAEFWRRQALRLAFRRQRRFASTVPELALSWAQEQARLAQAYLPS
jgi:hypothetical protein